MGEVMTEAEKNLPKLNVRIKAEIPGTLFSIDLPEPIPIEMKGITRADKTIKIEFKAIAGVGYLILEGSNAELKKLADIIKVYTKGKMIR